MWVIASFKSVPFHTLDTALIIIIKTWDVNEHQRCVSPCNVAGLTCHMTVQFVTLAVRWEGINWRRSKTANLECNRKKMRRMKKIIALQKENAWYGQRANTVVHCWQFCRTRRKPGSSFGIHHSIRYYIEQLPRGFPHYRSRAEACSRRNPPPPFFFLLSETCGQCKLYHCPCVVLPHCVVIGEEVLRNFCALTWFFNTRKTIHVGSKKRWMTFQREKMKDNDEYREMTWHTVPYFANVVTPRFLCYTSSFWRVLLAGHFFTVAQTRWPVPRGSQFFFWLAYLQCRVVLGLAISSDIVYIFSYRF